MNLFIVSTKLYINAEYKVVKTTKSKDEVLKEAKNWIQDVEICYEMLNVPDISHLLINKNWQVLTLPEIIFSLNMIIITERLKSKLKLSIPDVDLGKYNEKLKENVNNEKFISLLEKVYGNL